PVSACGRHRSRAARDMHSARSRSADGAGAHEYLEIHEHAVLTIVAGEAPMRTFESAARSDKCREPQREVRPDEAAERLDPGARASGCRVRPAPGPPGAG